MLTKIAIFAVLGFVIYFMLKSKFSPKKEQNDDKTELVECKGCNTFVASSELKNGLCKDCLLKG